MTNQKAYIVSRGAYSDYRVIAVFTDEEKAEEYVEASNNALNLEDYDSFRVEEQRLNPEPTEYNKYAWAEVGKDGQVIKEYGSRSIGASGTTENIHDAYKRTAFQEENKWHKASVTVTVPGHDTDKAVRKARKIAEQAQEEGWWGDDDKLRKILDEDN